MPDTEKKLVLCKCGKIGVDGTLTSTRIVGDINFLKTVFKVEESYSYRIKQVSTGLYFKPSKYGSRKNFSKKGKFYAMKPSLKWVSGVYRADCVIEKYLLTLT